MIMIASSSIVSLVIFSTLSHQTCSFAFSCGRHPPRTERRFPDDARAGPFREPSARCGPSGPPTRTNMAGDPSADDCADEIRFLGSGDDAIIRPGVVLLAPNHEYDHFLRRSAVFVYAIGQDEREDTVVRGVVLDHPTAFSIGEMSPNVMGSLSDNVLFRGGYDGNDSAMMLHSAGGPDGPVESEAMIGSSGIYEGGIASAMESADTGEIETNRCKFFFSHMQFTVKELDNMFAGTEDGDAWMSLEIPPEYVLDSDYGRSDLWSKLRTKSQHFRSNA